MRRLIEMEVAALLLAGSCALALPASAQDLSQSDTQYAVGQRMVECAAFFKAYEKLSFSLAQNATAQHMKEKANGWRIAGTFWLLGGLPDSKKPAAGDVAEYIETPKYNYLLALIEQGEAGIKRISSEFDKECLPLADFQVMTVNALRRN